MLLTKQIKIVRTIARILSVLLFLLWGSFFVEHLSWFSVEAKSDPPILVWLAQITHLFLLVGYLVTLKSEKAGSVLVVVNALIFFGYAAGINSIPFTLVSAFPVMLYSFCWMKEKHIRSTTIC